MSTAEGTAAAISPVATPAGVKKRKRMRCMAATATREARGGHRFRMNELGPNRAMKGALR